MYNRQEFAIGGGGNNRTFAFRGIILVQAAVFFGIFKGFLHVFLMYSCSKSFRELKIAIKNQFFFYLGGLGAKLSF